MLKAYDSKIKEFPVNILCPHILNASFYLTIEESKNLIDEINKIIKSKEVENVST